MAKKFIEPFERLSNVDGVEVIQVVKVLSLVGEGDGVGSPKRQITEYFSMEGERLARVDKYVESFEADELGRWSTEDASPTPSKEEQRAE